MDTFKSVLVALDVTVGGPDDPSPETLAALSQAAWIARAGDVALTLFTVLPEAEPEHSAAEPELLALAEYELRKLGETHLEGVELSLVVATGTSFIEIVRKVLRDGHDLLIVGPRSTHRRHPGVVGSTARRLVRKAPCPVLVAPRDTSGPPTSVLSAVAFHAATEQILSVSAAICAETGASWNVLHVPEYPAEGGMRLRAAPEEELIAYRKEVRERAWTRMHEVIDPLAESTQLAPELWMSEGLPSEEIVDAVDKLDAELVVMGTIGRPGLAGLLLGSTAEKVLDELDVSLLVIKPPDFVSPVTLED